jgi:hypothetical protein
MNDATKVRGHFGLVYPQNTPNNTTVTTMRKSRTREKEAAKKLKLLKDTGSSSIARSYDGTIRRWQGVKGHGSD